jgi:hypothetical protein
MDLQTKLGGTAEYSFVPKWMEEFFIFDLRSNTLYYSFVLFRIK